MTLIGGLIIKIFVGTLIVLILGVWILTMMNVKNTRDYERSNYSPDYEPPSEIKSAFHDELPENARPMVAKRSVEKTKTPVDDSEEKASNS